jgi:putative SOS response-associated peptidase YedK
MQPRASGRSRQRYAPFGLAGVWENWKDPTSGEWVRTFAIITTDANELVADIHERMPVIRRPRIRRAGLARPRPARSDAALPAELMCMCRSRCA